MYCRKCGNEIDESYSHCGYCGDDRSETFEPNKTKVRVTSALAYVSILFFLPLVICPESEKGRFHANQGLVLLIINAIISVVFSGLIVLFTFMIISQAYVYDIEANMTILIVGIVGEVIACLALFGIGIFLFVIQILGIVNGARGIEKKLPLIGRYKIIK